MRAIAGKVLAAEIVESLNNTISTQGKSQFNVQFGAYATFSSFFGLADLPMVNPDFYGMVDYASSMTFELVTNASTSSSFPAASDISVRFLFHNGTASADSTPTAYPLFGTGKEVIPWNDFVTSMDKFSIGSTQAWCTACGNSTGTCAAYAPSSSSGNNNASAQNKQSGNGLSPVVNGVIGAMVTLAIVLGLEALVLLVGGLRVVSKKTLAANAAVVSETVTGGKVA
jgi:hypothetical protein